jgi:hypothetical protein
MHHEARRIAPWNWVILDFDVGLIGVIPSSTLRKVRSKAALCGTRATTPIKSAIAAARVSGPQAKDAMAALGGWLTQRCLCHGDGRHHTRLRHAAACGTPFGAPEEFPTNLAMRIEMLDRRACSQLVCSSATS